MRQQVEQARRRRDAEQISGNVGCATSPSTSSTVVSTSIAMLIARLIAVNVLPSPGKRAGDHDQVAVAALRAGVPPRIAQDRPLDDAEFVGDLRPRCIGGDEPERFQALEIDREHGGLAAAPPARSALLPVQRLCSSTAGEPAGRSASCGRRVERADDRFRRRDALAVLRGGVVVRQGPNLRRSALPRAAILRAASRPVRSGSPVAPHATRPIRRAKANTAANEASNPPSPPANR